MTHLLVMLRDSCVQVMDWTLFQNTRKNAFFIDSTGNTTNTFVYVKFNDCIQKYTFDVGGKLKDISTESVASLTA